MSKCHKCGTLWSGEGQPGFREACPACMAYLHCCHNCRFHDLQRHNECRIPNVEFVQDRFGANFCEEFEFSVSGEVVQASRNKALQTFASLFGESEPYQDASDEAHWEAKGQTDGAREAFHRLFKD